LNGPTEFGAHHPIPTQFTTDPKKLSKPRDILFCVRGSTTGRMNWSDQNYAIGRGIAAIRHRNNGELQPLIRAAIEYELPRLLQAATGSTFPNVSATPLAGVPFPSLAPEEELYASALLGTLDDKIDLNRRMNETLEAMARAIFKDWFIDFGPTRAKMEGRAPYLAPKIWALFPDRLDDEGKPEGWSGCGLGDLAELNPPERLPEGTLASYIEMAALPVRGSSPDAPILREAGSGARFRNDDTLFARITPCLENGKTAYVTGLRIGEVAWGSTEFIVIRPRPPVPPEFGYLLARDESFRTHAIKRLLADGKSLINVRFGLLCGLKSDISGGPRSANSCHPRFIQSPSWHSPTKRSAR
jgi:type I restriction enzyme, S subunit